MTITYATFDPANTGTSCILSNGNLTATSNGVVTWNSTIATISKNTGKHIWEIHKDNLGGFGGSKSGFINGANLASILPAYITVTGNGVSWSAGAWEMVGTFAASGSVPANAIKWLMFAVDIPAGKGWIADANVWANSGDPVAGTNPSFTFPANSTIYPAVSVRANTDAVTANFGASAWFNNTVAATLVAAGYKNGLFNSSIPVPVISNQLRRRKQS